MIKRKRKSNNLISILVKLNRVQISQSNKIVPNCPLAIVAHKVCLKLIRVSLNLEVRK